MSKKNKCNQNNKWTADLLKEHIEALRVADQRAIQIKEQADEKALDLARQIQTYKDEKANELREQINSERGDYLTKTEYNASKLSSRTLIFSILGLIAAYGTTIILFATGAIK